MTALEPALAGEARALAARLRLPSAPRAGSAWALEVYRREAALPWGLRLRLLGRGAPGPVETDLTGGRLGHRLRRVGRHQDLARAVGLHRSPPGQVLDLTAGLGQDAAVLAGLGCELLLAERSPVLHALLERGIEHALATGGEGARAAARMRLLAADALDVLAETVPADAVVYLDPMYPEPAGRGRTAAPRKEMQVLRAVAGADTDADALLPAALEAGARRVVVKRPRLAPPLAGRLPDHRILGRSTRFDVYLRR